MQKIPQAPKYHRFLLPWMPAAIEQFDFSDFDLVISSTSSGCAKGILTGPQTTHICYCHNPSRVLWDGSQQYIQLHRPNFLLRHLIPRQLTKMRIWDQVAASRVDSFLANSQFVAARIKKYYQREAQVIYPPVELTKFQPTESPPKDYFLAVGRLIPYKRFDLVIAAAKRARIQLKIVGTGPELQSLKNQAGGAVEFCGQVSEAVLQKMYAECQALIFPQVEDFGLTPVEVNASGRPVVALQQGGACEVVVPNKTGIFFAEQTAESLAEALQRVQKKTWNEKLIRQNAERFQLQNFQKQIRLAVGF